MSEKAETWWMVRLKIEDLDYHRSQGIIFFEERTLWAETSEDAIAKAAGDSNAERIVGATVRQTEAP